MKWKQIAGQSLYEDLAFNFWELSSAFFEVAF